MQKSEHKTQIKKERKNVRLIPLHQGYTAKGLTLGLQLN